MTGRRIRALDVQIDRAALRHNFAEIKRLAPAAKVFAVVKADAYGHGAVEVARSLPEADGFAVVATAEATELREQGETRPLLLMQGPRDRQDAERCRKLSLWPAVHHEQQIAWLADADAATGAWLKVDTGMGRLGVSMQAAPTLLQRADIQWRGVMSHLACADAPGNAHTDAQLQAFAQLDVPPGTMKSVANSAAVVSGRGIGYDWVRPGLMLYGCNPLDGVPLPEGVVLKPVMQVSAPLIAIKSLPAGAGIGYAQTWTTPEAMSVGYAAVGYADGLPRVLDSTASVLINGQRCPIVGRVSMDSIAIDLRPAPQAVLGDRVTLWGQGQPAEHLAAAAGTIAYELLTSVRGELRYV